MKMHFGMVRHAFGYTGQAEELLLALHNQRRDSRNMHFFDTLVKIVVGESVLAKTSTELLSQTTSLGDTGEGSCFHYLCTFVAKAKEHPLYGKMQQVLGKDPVCAEAIATRTLAIMKQNQIRSVTGLSDVDVLPAQTAAKYEWLVAKHHVFDKFLALYLVRFDGAQKTLQALLKNFQTLDVSNFSSFAEFVKGNQFNVWKLVEDGVNKISDIIGENNFQKLKAMPYVLDNLNDEKFAIVQKIIEKFAPNVQLSALLIAAFFTSLETEIREKAQLGSVSPAQLIGEACLYGFNLIGCYHDSNVIGIVSSMRLGSITTELMFWSILGRLPALGAPVSDHAWSPRVLEGRVAPLLKQFKAQSVLSVLQERSADFNRICGETNIQALLQYLGNLTRKV